MYNLPQEIEVWYIIPAIRKELAVILVKKYEKTLEEAGETLGVSKAAVSQYIKGKRARKIKFPLIIKKEIAKSAKLLSKNKNFGLREILRLLNIIKQTKSGCCICRKYNKGIIKICGMKPIKIGEV